MKSRTSSRRSSAQPKAQDLKPFKKVIQDDLLEPSPGFLSDLRTGQWLRHPQSSFTIIVLVLLAYALCAIFYTPTQNPIRYFLCPSYKHATKGLYAQGPLDWLFVAFYVVVFSCVRQVAMYTLLRPCAVKLGVPQAKRLRFMEQAYAFWYFTFASLAGLYIMSRSDIWWFNTRSFWANLPQHYIPIERKAYYLLESAYWISQALVLLARLEKPRSDFTELVFHHFITLWLIGWSYHLGLTSIGLAIYVSMNIPDIFLALSKVIHYVVENTAYEWVSNPPFVFFSGVWIYFRHYLNLVILWSVAYEYDKYMPRSARTAWRDFSLWNRQVFVPPFRWLIFASIFALQVVNIYWLYLIMKILIRGLLGHKIEDVRSEAGDLSDIEPSIDSKHRVTRSQSKTNLRQRK